VIFGGMSSAHKGFHSMLLDALVDAGLGVLLLPRLRQRRQEAQQRRLVQAARSWLNGQAWSSNLSQGLLGCGSMAAPVLDFAGWPENLLRAVAVYEGKPDMSEANLEAVRVPTLFVTSSEHPEEEELNREMAYCLHCESRLVILDNIRVPPKVVAEWFTDHFGTQIGVSPEGSWQGGDAKTFDRLAENPAYQ
jgi:hypothetical protein